MSLNPLQDHPAPPNWPASGYITCRAGKITSRKFVASVTSESTYPVFRTNKPAVSETIPLCSAVGESACLRSPSSFSNHAELTWGSARWSGQVTAESASALNVLLDLWVHRDWRIKQRPRLMQAMLMRIEPLQTHVSANRAVSPAPSFFNVSVTSGLNSHSGWILHFFICCCRGDTNKNGMEHTTERAQQHVSD